MPEIKVVDVSTLPVESKKFKDMSLPFFDKDKKVYGVMDLDAYQSHIVSVVGNKTKEDAGLVLKFVGFTDEVNINTSIVSKNPIAEVYFSNAKKMFVFKDGNTFYLQHETLSATYNEGSTVRQDKIFLNNVVLYSYDKVQGGIMRISDVEIVQDLGDSTLALISQDAVTRKFAETTTDTISKLAKKVDKERGKGLSANDYTTEEKIKLGSVEEGAQKNIFVSEFGERIDAAPTQQIFTNEISRIDNVMDSVAHKKITPQMLDKSTIDLINASGGGSIMNNPDEEDITSVSTDFGSVLKLKNKEHSPINFSGMGRVYLRKNIKMINGKPKNVLEQKMFENFDRTAKTDTVYIIQYDYDLNGAGSNGKEPITIPQNCTLKFEGGSLSNGTIIGQNSIIQSEKLIFHNINCQGTWNCKGEAHWYAEPCKVDVKEDSFFIPIANFNSVADELQLLLNSTFSIAHFRNGFYYIDKTLNINHQIDIEMDGDIFNEYLSSRSLNDLNKTAIFTNKNISLLYYNNFIGRINIKGGNLDCSYCYNSPYNVSCIDIDISNNSIFRGIYIDCGICGAYNYNGLNAPNSIGIKIDGKTSQSDKVTSSATHIFLYGHIRNFCRGIYIHSELGHDNPTNEYKSWISAIYIYSYLHNCNTMVNTNISTYINIDCEGIEVFDENNGKSFINLTGSGYYTVGGNIWDIYKKNNGKYGIQYGLNIGKDVEKVTLIGQFKNLEEFTNNKEITGKLKALTNNVPYLGGNYDNTNIPVNFNEGLKIKGQLIGVPYILPYDKDCSLFKITELNKFTKNNQIIFTINAVNGINYYYSIYSIIINSNGSKDFNVYIERLYGNYNFNFECYKNKELSYIVLFLKKEQDTKWFNSNCNVLSDTNYWEYINIAKEDIIKEHILQTIKTINIKGLLKNRPQLPNIELNDIEDGFQYYATDKKRPVYKINTEYYYSDGTNINIKHEGTTLERPTSIPDGFMYKDTSIGKLIWKLGTKWVDSAGEPVA